MNCAEVQELYGAIALDALPSDELAAVNAHLATCAACREALRPLRQVALRLLEAAPLAEPAIALRSRILAAARADLLETQRNGVAAVATRSAPLAGAREPLLDSQTVDDTEPGAPSVIIHRDAAWWRRPAWSVAAAFVALAIGLGAWNVLLQRRIDRTDSRLAQAAERLASSEAALSAVGAEGRSFALASSRPGAGGALLRPLTGPPVLLLHGLARQPGTTYQMWAVHAGETTSLGLFLPDDRGDARLTMPESLATADSIAVTAEPGPNGSERPTSAPILIALLHA